MSPFCILLNIWLVILLGLKILWGSIFMDPVAITQISGLSRHATKI